MNISSNVYKPSFSHQNVSKQRTEKTIESDQKDNGFALNQLNDTSTLNIKKEKKVIKQIDSRNFLKFPPENASEEVKEAFDNLSEAEKKAFSPLHVLHMVRQLTPGGYNSFLNQINGLHKSLTDGSLKTVQMYNDFFNKKDFSYEQFASEMIRAWEKSKQFNSPENYQERKAALVRFQKNLLEKGDN
ncbi:hypothetical protein [Bacillus solimangrovi]|uniref:Uncharacterized protein n=1 Tax=Bacillus solimangrovi TaxID=1305675 RepID=A0A1E5LJV1_9BACI|nr:hypothetical protein [Bacillus solimangrovi]OEH94354.1 hypothetical protein BFG57_08850 [Bacillus solimangrovi]